MATTSSSSGKRLTRATTMILASLVSAGLSVASCADNDAMILVRVTGTVSGPIYRFQVQAEAQKDSRSFSVPDRPQMISLPTSFSLQVPPNHEGQFSIELQAFDDEEQLVGEGRVLLENLRPGEATTIDVQLEPVTSPKPDAGGKPKADGSTTNVDRKDAPQDGDDRNDTRKDASFDAAVKDAADEPSADTAPPPKLDAMEKLDTQPPPEVDAAPADAGVNDGEGQGTATP